MPYRSDLATQRISSESCLKLVSCCLPCGDSVLYRTDEEKAVRRNQFRAACPGIGWEREQRKPTVIGGRSSRWRPTAETQPQPEVPDEDTVIIRGTD